MTTVQSYNNSDALLRPTDLSIKSCLSGKYDGGRRAPVSPTITSYESKDHKALYDMEYRNQWRHRIDEPKTTTPSPMAFVFGRGDYAMSRSASRRSTSPPQALDSTAKLVVLDNLFSHCNGHSPIPVFDPSPGCRLPRSRGNSDSSNEKFPVSSSLLVVAQSLAEMQRMGVNDERSAPSAANHHTSNEGRRVTTPTTPASSRGRGCKRKGGWKFHDMSEDSDGLGKRKRAYCSNRLENEILQLYQDRVTIKELPGLNASKFGERLVVIEPTYISDPDLVKHNTGLRILFDKKKGIYQLQVLPFTIEQGSLSNKHQVLAAVSKMLADNGAVLCPGITRAFLTPHLYNGGAKASPSDAHRHSPAQDSHQHNSSMKRKNWLGFTPATSDSSSEGESGAERYRGRWKILNSMPCEDDHDSNSAATPTDKLLITLNKELSKMQRQRASSPHTVPKSDNCLIWHVPTTGGKGKRSTWPQDAKWCTNCLKRIYSASEFCNTNAMLK